MTASPVQQKMTIEVASLLLGRFSPRFDRIFVRQMLTKLDWRDVNTMLDAIPANMAQYMNMHGAANGRDRADAFVPGDQSNGQAIRAGINAPNEGAIA